MLDAFTNLPSDTDVTSVLIGDTIVVRRLELKSVLFEAWSNSAKEESKEILFREATPSICENPSTFLVGDLGFTGNDFCIACAKSFVSSCFKSPGSIAIPLA